MIPGNKSYKGCHNCGSKKHKGNIDADEPSPIIREENENMKEMKALIAARDDAVQKMQNSTTQYEIMQVQLREAQARHWDELQRAKETEAQLSEETEKITQELQDKTLKLIAIEAERAKYEDSLRNEVGSASHMAVALRTELEKRLDELTQARRERYIS
jgi:preprotein translocase subunit SecD